VRDEEAVRNEEDGAPRRRPGRAGWGTRRGTRCPSWGSLRGHGVDGVSSFVQVHPRKRLQVRRQQAQQPAGPPPSWPARPTTRALHRSHPGHFSAASTSRTSRRRRRSARWWSGAVPGRGRPGPARERREGRAAHQGGCQGGSRGTECRTWSAGAAVAGEARQRRAHLLSRSAKGDRARAGRQPHFVGTAQLAGILKSCESSTECAEAGEPRRGEPSREASANRTACRLQGSGRGGRHRARRARKETEGGTEGAVRRGVRVRGEGWARARRTARAVYDLSGTRKLTARKCTSSVTAHVYC